MKFGVGSLMHSPSGECKSGLDQRQVEKSEGPEFIWVLAKGFNIKLP